MMKVRRVLEAVLITFFLGLTASYQQVQTPSDLTPANIRSALFPNLSDVEKPR